MNLEVAQGQDHPTIKAIGHEVGIAKLIGNILIGSSIHQDNAAGIHTKVATVHEHTANRAVVTDAAGDTRFRQHDHHIKVGILGIRRSLHAQNQRISIGDRFTVGEVQADVGETGGEEVAGLAIEGHRQRIAVANSVLGHRIGDVGSIALALDSQNIFQAIDVIANLSFTKALTEVHIEAFRSIVSLGGSHIQSVFDSSGIRGHRQIIVVPNSTAGIVFGLQLDGQHTVGVESLFSVAIRIARAIVITIVSISQGIQHPAFKAGGDIDVVIVIVHFGNCTIFGDQGVGAGIGSSKATTDIVQAGGVVLIEHRQDLQALVRIRFHIEHEVSGVGRSDVRSVAGGPHSVFLHTDGSRSFAGGGAADFQPVITFRTLGNFNRSIGPKPPLSAEQRTGSRIAIVGHRADFTVVKILYRSYNVLDLFGDRRKSRQTGSGRKQRQHSQDRQRTFCEFFHCYTFFLFYWVLIPTATELAVKSTMEE